MQSTVTPSRALLKYEQLVASAEKLESVALWRRAADKWAFAASYAPDDQTGEYCAFRSAECAKAAASKLPAGHKLKMPKAISRYSAALRT